MAFPVSEKTLNRHLLARQGMSVSLLLAQNQLDGWRGPQFFVSDFLRFDCILLHSKVIERVGAWPFNNACACVVEKRVDVRYGGGVRE